MTRRLLSLGLKLGVIPAIVAAMMFAGSVNDRTQPAEAAPIQAYAFNEAHCITLGVAFGGVPGVVGLFNCAGLGNQVAFQTYAGCLAGLRDANGQLFCPNPIPDTDPNYPFQPEPELFTAITAFDDDQIHAGQPYSIIAFVDDDFPVRFTTDRGRFAGPLGQAAGQELICSTTDPDFAGSVDPDCDQDPTTLGDGVVVGKLILDPEDGDDGVVNVNVVQENIGFPIELKVTGPPDEITLAPFGKDTLQTGATPGTPGCGDLANPAITDCEKADPTDCNANLSVEGVLGAAAKAEQTLVVAKALDRNGVEVSGAVIAWYVVDPDGDNTKNGAFSFGDNRLKQGGVIIPQTPTIQTGALGIGFPQFVCGGQTPGELTLEARFDDGSSSSVNFHIYADFEERERITLNVISGPETMTLAAVPPVINCDGLTTSTVTATVLNADGVPVANGVDVSWSVVALGTTSPLKGDTAAGVHSTVVTPLSLPADPATDEPRGVTVIASVIGDDDNPLEVSTIVQCSGAPPPPGTDTGTGDSGGGGGGPISPPDTGTGGQAAAEPAMWVLAALGAGAAVLGVAGGLSRRMN